MTTVHITGATGFLGTNLCKFFLKSGYEVNAISRIESEHHLIEFKNPKFKITTYEPNGMHDLEFNISPGDTLIHAASSNRPRHMVNQKEMLAVNVGFGIRLMSLAASTGAKFLNIGTNWQHYKNEPYNPVSIYAASKEAHEVFQKYFVQVEGLSAKTLELCDTYGPSDPRDKLIPLLMNVEVDSAPINLTDGNQMIDLVHIADVVQAIYSIILGWEKGIDSDRMSLSSSRLISIRELVRQCEKVKGFKFPIKWGSIAPQNSRQMHESWAHFPIPTGWKPTVLLEEGLNEIAKS
jgi:nucleoside-diphosphate-sugar epimerase